MIIRSLGIYLRWICLLAFISYQIYFFLYGSILLNNNEGEMAGIFICDNNSNNDDVLTQCAGSDDMETCGSGIECIRSSCGRPLFVHIGISYAGSADPFDSDAATSTHSFTTIASLIYSLIPYALIMLFSIQFLALGNVVPLTRLGLIGFVSLIDDGLLKNIIKQPRPTGSCLYFHSYGMPSGHAATSIGLLTFMLLELFQYHPNLFGKRQVELAIVTENCDVEGEQREPTSDFVDNTFVWGYGWEKPLNREGYLCCCRTESNGLGENMLSHDDYVVEEAAVVEETTTTSDTTEPYNIIHIQPRGFHLQSKWLHHYVALIWTFLLLPVALSRVFLHDHSPSQILVGSLEGIVLGNVWYYFVCRGFLSGALNSRSIMEFLVNCRLGKWIGLNLGAGEGKLAYQR